MNDPNTRKSSWRIQLDEEVAQGAYINLASGQS